MTMPTQTPIRWLQERAAADPARLCIVTPGGSITYGGLWDMVRSRAAVLAAGSSEGRLVPVRATLELGSIAEILATSAAGSVPLPHRAGAPVFDAGSVSDDAVCVATSGSSGSQRIVRISSANIEASVAASRDRLDTGPDDRWLLCLPIDHVGGLSILWRSFEAGGSVAMAPFNLDLPRFMQTSQPTVASMVPTMAYRLMRADPEELAALRFLLIGGARTPPDLRISAAQHGVTLLRSYGATETTSQIATSTAPDDPDDPSVGFPLEGVDVRIVAGAGQTAITGSVGRIEVDGPTVSPGYFGEPPRTGPFLTSDLGSMTTDGRLIVHGRIDDMILSGGENVFLSTVTDAARSLGGVNDAVAVGVPDPEWGTAVVVVVDTSRRIDALDGEIRQVLRRREVPKKWVTVDSIPMLSNGKHDMAAIRDLAVSR